MNCRSTAATILTPFVRKLRNRVVSEKYLDPIIACHGEKIWELKSAVTGAEMFCEMAKGGIVVVGSSVIRATLVYR